MLAGAGAARHGVGAMAMRPGQPRLFCFCVLLVLALLLPVDARMRRRSDQERAEARRNISHVTSPLPLQLLTDGASDLPSSWDWRYSKGPGLVSRVISQQAPHVCGSCWAEAAMGALSDRYRIATAGAVDVQLAVQVLLNFDPHLTGGDCSGGDALKGYKFVKRFGITDDTCAPFIGESFGDNSMGETQPEGNEDPIKKEAKVTAFVRARMCHFCDWDGNCDWLNTSSVSDERVADSPSAGKDEIGIGRRYSVDEYGPVHGNAEMMAEIMTRGPIVCSIDSAPAVFNQYAPSYNASTGRYDHGIIRHPPQKHNDTDHDIVLTGWGTEDGA
eukprot:COSAG05_NODE_52_length_23775_cov_49.471110_5_plen_330_part_00